MSSFRKFISYIQLKVIKMAHIENTGDLKTTEMNGYKMPFKQCDGIDYNFWSFLPDNIEEHLKGLRNLQVRPDDVFICTHPRSGTQWTSEIVNMLKSGSSSYCKKHVDWFDIVPADILDKMSSPRICVSHFPFKFLPQQLAGTGKVICVFRNPKDVAVSFYHLLISYNSDIAEFDGNFDDFLRFFLNGDLPGGSWFDHVKSWESVIANNSANPLLVLYYENMKRDLRSHVKKIADFLEVGCDDELVSNIAEKCKAENMLPEKKSNIPNAVAIQSKDGGNFQYRKGQIGDWKYWFTVAQNEQFDILYNERMKDSKLSFNY